MIKIVAYFLIFNSVMSCDNRKAKSLEVLTEKKSSIEGVYKTTIDSNFTENCEITLEILRTKNRFSYHLKTEERDVKGKIIFDDNNEYILLQGIKWDEYEGDVTNENDSIENNLKAPDYVDVSIGVDTLTIQNYGNAMNRYTKLGECGRKHITLVKQ